MVYFINNTLFNNEYSLKFRRVLGILDTCGMGTKITKHLDNE